MTPTPAYNTVLPEPILEALGMRDQGSKSYRADRGYWIVKFQGKQITKWRGYRMFVEQMADACLREINDECRAAERGECKFRIEKWTHGEIHTVKYLYDWLQVVEDRVSEKTCKIYEGNVRRYLDPWFTQHPNVTLQKISLMTLTTIVNTLPPDPHTRRSVMSTLRTCLDFAWRDEQISHVPPFPRRSEYGFVKKPIPWLPEQRQLAVIHAMPEEHQPIFAWCKYHYRRPGEGRALQKADFDGQVFHLRHNISNNKLVNKTKTKTEFEIPCHEDFRPYLRKMHKSLSPYFFTHSHGQIGKPYGNTTLEKIWRFACERVGEVPVRMYIGLKHSSCCQFLNEKGGTLAELAELTGQTVGTLAHYTQTEPMRRKELMERKIQKISKGTENGHHT